MPEMTEARDLFMAGLRDIFAGLRDIFYVAPTLVKTLPSSRGPGASRFHDRGGWVGVKRASFGVA